MRWNVVIGGQLFSKSFLGYTTYKMALATKEGLLAAIVLSILPFVILFVLLKLLALHGPTRSPATLKWVLNPRYCRSVDPLESARG